jgi:hypothetical protein
LKKQKADIRILIRSGNQYAVAFYATLQGYDLYSGPGLGFGPKDMGRHSYHESGKSHLRVPTSEGRAISEPDTPLAHLKGKQKIGASSSDMNALKWDARPKPDSAKRRTIIMDLEALTVPSFTSELWTIEPGKPELIEEIFQLYESHAGVVLAHVLADWCTPNLLGVVWTLRSEAWANLARSMAGESG